MRTTLEWCLTHRYQNDARLGTEYVWKSHSPTIRLNTATYETGIALTKQEMASIEDRPEHNPLLPKYDILIRLA